MGVVERATCVALVLMAGLAGCATSSPNEESMYQGMGGVTQKPTLPRSRPIVDDDGKCRDYGFLPGTVDYGQCRSLLRQGTR
jgi:hypothetical protein